MASENNNIESDKDGSNRKSDTGGLVMREEYHSPFGRTAKNACIEPCSLCLPSSFIHAKFDNKTRKLEKKDHLLCDLRCKARQGSFHITH